MRPLQHTSLSLLFFVYLLLLFTPSVVYGLSDSYKIPFRQEIQFLVAKAPPYVWGCADERGADCSGLVWWAAKRAGMPVKRTTAISMWRGEGNWLTKEQKFNDLDELDIMWWSWRDKPNRPFGHVGLVIEANNGLYQIFHASASRGHAIIQPCSGSFVRDYAGGKRLIFGEGK